MNRTTITAIATISLLLASPLAMAKKPSAAALAACSGLSEGDAAEFVGKKGNTISGICVVTKNGNLAAKGPKEKSKS